MSHLVYGVLPAGFVPRTFEQLKAELEEILIRSFGPSINLSPQSPQGQLVDNLARFAGEGWEAAQDIYQSFDPRSAVGVNLDIIATIRGQSRRAIGESDEDFRIRLISATETTTNLTEDLIASLTALTGVSRVSVNLNETNDILADGTPANSYSAVVIGGSDQEVANVIWKTHPAGITMFGNTEFEIEDDANFCRIIKFTRPQSVDIEVEIKVSFLDSSGSCNILTEEEIEFLFVSNASNSSKNTFGFRILPSWISGLLSNEPNLLVESVRFKRLTDNAYQEVIDLTFDEIANFDLNNISVSII